MRMKEITPNTTYLKQGYGAAASEYNNGLFSLNLTQNSVFISHYSNSIPISHFFISTFSITPTDFCLGLVLKSIFYFLNSIF